MHSSAQFVHIILQASSMAIMLDMSMPMGRIIMRIMVLQTSAQFMHMLEHFIIASPIEASAHIVHACSQAAQASIQSCIICIIDASMEGIPSMLAMSIDIVFIISAVMLMIVTHPEPLPGGEHHPVGTAARI
jgi:hypothetical protein